MGTEGDNLSEVGGERQKVSHGTGRPSSTTNARAGEGGGKPEKDRNDK